MSSYCHLFHGEIVEFRLDDEICDLTDTLTFDAILIK